MARMSIDDKVGRDPRIAMLAIALGWSKRETVGCLVLDVWPLCYDQESPLISERLIDAASGRPGFAQAMIESELATRDRGGKVRVHGARERIRYLQTKKRAGVEGGLKSAESRRNKVKQTSSTSQAQVKQTSSTSQAPGNPSVPDSASASASASASVPEGGEPPPAAGADARGVKPRSRSTTEQLDAFRKAKQAFSAAYKSAYGIEPTWGAKQNGQLAGLISAHGADEVARRVGVLFASPPRFLRGPHDLGTLVQHFDKLVKPSEDASDARYGRVAEKHLITNEDVDADQEWLRIHAPGMVVR